MWRQSLLPVRWWQTEIAPALAVDWRECRRRLKEAAEMLPLYFYQAVFRERVGLLHFWNNLASLWFENEPFKLWITLYCGGCLRSRSLWKTAFCFFEKAFNWNESGWLYLTEKEQKISRLSLSALHIDSKGTICNMSDLKFFVKNNLAHTHGRRKMPF